MAVTKEKKHLRRRSNWYIYLISFAATTVLLLLFILAFWDSIFPPSTPRNTNIWGDIVPGSEFNATVLFMMGEEEKSVPNYFMLMNYRPGDDEIALVPLNPDTHVASGAKSGKLTDLYKHGGAQSVMAAIGETLGVDCDFFVHFDRSSFVGFTNLLGEIRVNVPYFFEGGGIDLNTGEHFLSGGDLYTYMSYADFPQAGEDYNLVIQGSAIMSMLNLNCRHLDSESIQEAFNKILNQANTDLSFRDFTHYQQALLYTSENSVNPANYYVPTGEYQAGEFVLSSQAVANIHQRFNIIG